LRCAVLDADANRVGRAFSGAAVEMALAGYPGFTMTSPPGKGSPYGVYKAAFVPNEEIEHVAVLPDGTRRVVAPAPVTKALDAETWEPPPPPAQPPPPPAQGGDPTSIVNLPERPSEATASAVDNPSFTGPSVRIPLGRIAGARSGDKGGDANIGVWARTEEQWRWLSGFLTAERLSALLPETRDLPVTRHVLPNLRAVNFVIEGLLQEGVAASTRFDPQGKALGEWLRARLVDVPEAVL
ncbi:exopolyphosphatase, partial [Actinomadura adrarensis]